MWELLRDCLSELDKSKIWDVMLYIIIYSVVVYYMILDDVSMYLIAF